MITVSLETAKKLKEAGWSNETIFDMDEKGEIRSTKNNYPYKAPTAQEILDELPMYIDTKSNEYGEIVLSMEGSATRRACFYSDMRRQCNYMDMYFVGDTLAEALASLRLRCKENNFLPINE